MYSQPYNQNADQISERPPQSAVFLFALIMLLRMTLWFHKATFRRDAKPCLVLEQQPTSGGALGSVGR